MSPDNPINVWYSDGVKYEDYRRSDGSIETVRAQCLGCGDAMAEDHQCLRNKSTSTVNGYDLGAGVRRIKNNDV